MSAPGDQELRALLADLESDRCERKQAWTKEVADKARQAICAFANDLPHHGVPGVLVIGVRDDGRPAGLEVTDQLLLSLADIKTDGKIVPPPSISVEKRHLDGAEIAVVTVEPADAPPVRYDGRIWIRIGPRRGIATAQDERILNEKRRFRDAHAEAWPVPSSTLADLSRLVFEQEYLPQAVAPDILAANERTYEQRLASCGMVVSADEPTPTVLGHLVLGISPRTWIPGHSIQFLRLQGTTLADPVIDETEIDGTLATVLRRLDEKLKAHLSTSVAFAATDREVRQSPYPLVALQQLIRNAVMHRTYEATNAPVRVYWFTDRIEILSPGGPYGCVTRENFGRPGWTDYRNPQLASAFKTLGYAQRFGAGIDLARRALKDNGNPAPVFEVDDNFVLVTVGVRP
ncbi:ATP-binding protein [Pararhodospirillum oryzae]|uniref:Transcriptional regulator n=1 Tax=Pararhodospirillum oryzae TaxID=478448 RepID=A0A512H5V7_9PROT|nr:ATP-binding protein [Pararhodospirillum oryzae]GEO80856.1 transcriptional regulator [Pararhodospirillum oryzae]